MNLKTSLAKAWISSRIHSCRRALCVSSALGMALATSACVIAPAVVGPESINPASVMPPTGYGSLLQTEVSMSLVSKDLEILVTPLEESVIRVTAPDTENRLRGIASAHRAALPQDGRLFLVSFYTNQADVAFVPEEIQIIAQELRVLPTGIAPVTPGWGQRRVLQRQTELAVYSFPSNINLESELVLVYGFDRTHSWSNVLTRIQSERARARARASGTNIEDERKHGHREASGEAYTSNP